MVPVVVPPIKPIANLIRSIFEWSKSRNALKIAKQNYQTIELIGDRMLIVIIVLCFTYICTKCLSKIK